MGRDLGVQRDIYDRHFKREERKSTTRFKRAEIRPLVDALIAVGSQKEAARWTDSDMLPTQRQLDAANDYLERKGVARVSCPVRPPATEWRRGIDAFDSMTDNRPLKPPGR